MTPHSRQSNQKRLHGLKPAAGPTMSLCILCSSPLTPDTKPEHVWQASLGGRKTTRRVLCSDCNAVLGSGPDKELAESVAFLRNLLNLESGRGKEPPTIKGLRHGRDKIVLRPGGIPEIKGGRPFVITSDPEGNQNVEVRVSSEEQLRRILPDLAAALGIELSDIKALLRKAQMRRVSQRIGTQHQRISLGGAAAMRSMFKTCLTLWADLHGADELQKPIYDDARSFVRNGSDMLAGTICQIDLGPLEGASALVERFGRHFNLAVVASDATGRTTGYFRLYNACAWRFTLCTADAPPSACVTYVSNPEQPSVWDSTVAGDLVAPAAILDTAPSHDFEAARAAFTRMYADYHKRASQDEISKICDEVAKKLGLDPHQAMTREQCDSYAQEVSFRMASWMVGVPYEESLSPESIASLIGED